MHDHKNRVKGTIRLSVFKGNLKSHTKEINFLTSKLRNLQVQIVGMLMLLDCLEFVGLQHIFFFKCILHLYISRAHRIYMYKVFKDGYPVTPKICLVRK